MNIFYLSSDPKECAEMHVDKHCSKMLVEYAQLMSTSHRVLDGKEYYDKDKIGRKLRRFSHTEPLLYKATHINHPSSIWVRQSKNNYKFLYEMWCCLHEEFVIRYGKSHLSYTKLVDILRVPPSNCSNTPFTQPPQAMPDDVKDEDAITAYRNYYIKHKNSIASWKTKIPSWYKGE